MAIVVSAGFSQHIENSGHGSSRQTSADMPLICQLENSKRILVKGGTLQNNIQNNIGVNKRFHSRYFASLSSRICSSVISPRLAATPKSASARGVGWERMRLSASECECGDVPSSVLLRAGSDLPAAAGVKVRITGPSGTSRGTSIVSRWLAGMSTVCVTLI